MMGLSHRPGTGINRAAWCLKKNLFPVFMIPISHMSLQFISGSFFSLIYLTDIKNSKCPVFRKGRSKKKNVAQVKMMHVVVILLNSP